MPRLALNQPKRGLPDPEQRRPQCRRLCLLVRGSGLVLWLVGAPTITSCETKVAQPEIHAAPGSDAIVVAHNRAAIPSGCELIATLTEDDGKSEPPGAYNGTAAGLEQRFTNDAVRLHANLVLIPSDEPENELAEVPVDCGQCRIRIWSTGYVYDCQNPRSLLPPSYVHDKS